METPNEANPGIGSAPSIDQEVTPPTPVAPSSTIGTDNVEAPSDIPALNNFQPTAPPIDTWTAPSESLKIDAEPRSNKKLFIIFGAIGALLVSLLIGYVVARELAYGQLNSAVKKVDKTNTAQMEQAQTVFQKYQVIADTMNKMTGATTSASLKSIKADFNSSSLQYSQALVDFSNLSKDRSSDLQSPILKYYKLLLGQKQKIFLTDLTDYANQQSEIDLENFNKEAASISAVKEILNFGQDGLDIGTAANSRDFDRVLALSKKYAVADYSYEGEADVKKYQPNLASAVDKYAKLYGDLYNFFYALKIGDMAKVAQLSASVDIALADNDPFAEAMEKDKAAEEANHKKQVALYEKTINLMDKFNKDKTYLSLTNRKSPFVGKNNLVASWYMENMVYYKSTESAKKYPVGGSWSEFRNTLKGKSLDLSCSFDEKGFSYKFISPNGFSFEYKEEVTGKQIKYQLVNDI